MSVASDISNENRTGGMSPLSITCDDDFRYKTVSEIVGFCVNLPDCEVDDQLPLQEDDCQRLDLR